MTMSINESMCEMIMNSYKNDMAVFEAVLRSDARELAYDRIIKEAEEEGDTDKAAEAKEAKKENSENTKKGLKETIQNVLYKISDTICKLLDKIADAIQDFKRNHIKKYVEKNKDAFMKADLSKLPEKKVKLFVNNNDVLLYAIDDMGFLDTISSDFDKLKEKVQGDIDTYKNADKIEEVDKDIYKKMVKAFKNKDLAEIISLNEDPKEGENIDNKSKEVDISKLKKEDIIKILTEENSMKGLHVTKNNFKNNTNKAINMIKNSDLPADRSSMLIKTHNAEERAAIKIINILNRIYKQNLSTCFSLFKKGVALGGKNAEEKKDVTSTDPETKATEENAITNEFEFVYESCFQM